MSIVKRARDFIDTLLGASTDAYAVAEHERRERERENAIIFAERKERILRKRQGLTKAA